MLEANSTRRQVLGAAVLGLTVAAPLVALAQAAAEASGEKRVEGVAREKVIWLFTRRPDFTRERFRQEYVGIHAPLGVKYTRGRPGYTVNLVDSESPVDDLTEQWVWSVEEHTTRGKAYDTPQDMAKVYSNRITNGRHDLYVVDEKVLRGEPLKGPLGQPTPGVKVVWFYRHGQPVPPPPPGATRVVDNRVLRNVVLPSHEPGTSGIELIRMAWAPDLASLGPSASDALRVTEYRFLPSPWK